MVDIDGQLPQPSKMAIHRLHDLLRHQAGTSSPSCLIFYPPGEAETPSKIPYARLYAQALKGSKLLQALNGFRAGCPVLLHLPDHWEAILWFWTTILAGGVPVLTPPFSNDPEQRSKHLNHLSTLFESPLCITTTRSLGLFDGGHTLQLHTIESLLLSEESAPLEHDLS